jgi:hypothetical protein
MADLKLKAAVRDAPLSKKNQRRPKMNDARATQPLQIDDQTRAEWRRGIMRGLWLNVSLLRLHLQMGEPGRLSLRLRWNSHVRNPPVFKLHFYERPRRNPR